MDPGERRSVAEEDDLDAASAKDAELAFKPEMALRPEMPDMFLPEPTESMFMRNELAGENGLLFDELTDKADCGLAAPPPPPPPPPANPPSLDLFIPLGEVEDGVALGTSG